MSSFSLSFFSPPGTGDITLDGLFNIQDLVTIVELITTGDSEPAPEQACIADGTQDGVVTVADIVAFVGLIVGGGPCTSGLPLFDYSNSVYSYCDCFPA